ncbi:ABC transporter permease [Bombella intestini]|uniref:ABC transporter permease n=2 Tax=Bombella intestini TaxID=1539051 RepID=A0A1S8GRP9_9PROT|nr:ABC transporter permease [Bombella intestini]
MMNFSERFAVINSGLAMLGRFARSQPRFFLIMIGAAWGVVYETLRPSSWRRTVIIEFRRNLRQLVGSGFFSVVVVAVITGLGLVSQAVYWLGFAGMAQMTGSLLSSVLLREIAPILVGVILLGRSGMLMLTEMGTLTTSGRLNTLNGMGIDPFLVFVVPRTIATTVSGITLGTIFSVIALGMGYVACWMKGIVTSSIWSFIFDVINSMEPGDYVGIPLKFLLSGASVGLCCCLSGMDVTAEDNLTTFMPRGFSRGIMSILVINVLIDIILGSL